MNCLNNAINEIEIQFLCNNSFKKMSLWDLWGLQLGYNKNSKNSRHNSVSLIPFKLLLPYSNIIFFSLNDSLVLSLYIWRRHVIEWWWTVLWLVHLSVLLSALLDFSKCLSQRKTEQYTIQQYTNNIKYCNICFFF